MQTTMRLTRDEAIIAGRKRRQKMIDIINRTLDSPQTQNYSSLIVCTPPGWGKTHTVLTELKKRADDIDYFIISGVTSLFSFGVSLALINADNDLLLTKLVIVDDCDALFRDEASLNVLKSVLGKDGVFRYEKMIQMNYLTDAQKEAVRKFMSNDRSGITIKTHNFKFIFCTNISTYISEQTFHELSSKSNPSKRDILKIHQYALASRLKTFEYRVGDNSGRSNSLSPEEVYGWIAYVILEELEISLDQKLEITTFLWDNWYRLSEKSIRTAEKMADLMENYPDTYKDIWIDEFLLH